MTTFSVPVPSASFTYSSPPTAKPGKAVLMPDFVAPDIVRTTVDKILEMKDQWHKTEPQANATIGHAWYKMINDGLLNVYHAEAATNNLILSRNFHAMEEEIWRVGATLEDPHGHFNIPVWPRTDDLGPYWSKFCFVIGDEESDTDDSDSTWGNEIPVPHMDYEGLAPYPAMLFSDHTRAYSAIFSLETPQFGGGLAVYEQRCLGSRFKAPSLSRGLNGDENFIRVAKGELGQPVELKYTPGSVAIIDSFCPHRILPAVFSSMQPRRTVLVVHYLYLDEPRPHFQYWC